jgi:hypothetical protein
MDILPKEEGELLQRNFPFRSFWDRVFWGSKHEKKLSRFPIHFLRAPGRVLGDGSNTSFPIRQLQCSVHGTQTHSPFWDRVFRGSKKFRGHFSRSENFGKTGISRSKKYSEKVTQNLRNPRALRDVPNVNILPKEEGELLQRNFPFRSFWDRVFWGSKHEKN